jgi:hypothetical protein
MARLPDDEIKRRFEANLEQCRISDEEALERWPEATPRQRENKRKLAEAAAARHATVVDDETGQRLLGGPQPNNRPRSKKSVMEAITDLADGERQQEVIDAIFAPLSDSNSAVRGKGAERIVKIAADQREMERRDREELRQLGKEELLERLAEGILSSGMAEALVEAVQNRAKQAALSPAREADAIDGTAVEEAA